MTTKEERYSITIVNKDGEEAGAVMVMQLTHEGLIVDVMTEDEEVIGTYAATADEFHEDHFNQGECK